MNHFEYFCWRIVRTRNLPTKDKLVVHPSLAKFPDGGPGMVLSSTLKDKDFEDAFKEAEEVTKSPDETGHTHETYGR